MIHFLSYKIISSVQTSDRMIDLWISCLVFLCGIHLLWIQPIENILQYRFLLDEGITSTRLGLIGLLIGSLNIMRVIRIVHHFKACEICGTALQCGNFAFCMLLFLSVLHNKVIPMGMVFYEMVSILSIVVIMKKEV